MMRPIESGTVAVFDVGKTNIKLSAVSRDGTVLETLSMVNPVLPGPPWQHHDLKTMRSWLLDGCANSQHGMDYRRSRHRAMVPAACWCAKIPITAATVWRCR